MQFQENLAKYQQQRLQGMLLLEILTLSKRPTLPHRKVKPLVKLLLELIILHGKH